MSPITPKSAIAFQLMHDQGLAESTMATVPILYCLLTTEIFILIASFFYFKGWRFEKPTGDMAELKKSSFETKQIISFIGLIIMLLLVLVLNMNVGLTCFMVGTVLIALGCGDEKTVFKSMPWRAWDSPLRLSSVYWAFIIYSFSA